MLRAESTTHETVRILVARANGAVLSTIGRFSHLAYLEMT